MAATVLAGGRPAGSAAWAERASANAPRIVSRIHDRITRAASTECLLPLPATKCLFSVAQIVNLLCRRLAIGSALEVRRSGRGAVLQDGILRYSRLAVCATRTTEALITLATKEWGE